MRSQLAGQVDGGGAVRAADDAGGSGFLRGETHHGITNDEGDKDAQLRGSAQQQALGVGNQGTEVGHAAHAQEDQAGVNAQLHAQIQVVQHAGSNDLAGGSQQLAANGEHLSIGQIRTRGADDDLRAVGNHGAVGGNQRARGVKRAAGGDGVHDLAQHVSGLIHDGALGGKGIGCRIGQRRGVQQHRAAKQAPVGMTARKQLLIVHARDGQVGQKHAKGNGHQQKRLVFFDHGQIHQHARDSDHNQRLGIAKQRINARILAKLD